MRKLFNSTIFRLTLLYATFFCASIILILTFIYFATVRSVDDHIKHRINAQLTQSEAVFNQHGIEELKKQTTEFMEEDDEGIYIYLLADSAGKVLVGNMENWPEDIQYSDSWLTFAIASKSEENGVQVLAGDKILKDGYHILVGCSLKELERIKKVMLDVVMASVILALLISVLGWMLFSNVIKRKLEEVNYICSQVIGGNLDVKVPTTGGDDEFEHLFSNVNAMLTRIAELVNGLRQTSDNIAHDLRTPLNRHRIRLEGILTHQPETKKVYELIKAGIEEVDTIVETLNSILRISQAQSGVSSGHFVTFDLSKVMINVVEFYEEYAAQKTIRMNDNIADGVSITGDKPLITQAIANLIDNAIKYIPENGIISITLRVTDRFVECVVADNGAGIPPTLYEKVKERFYRMEASRTSPGTGLGLSLVDAVANLHRGELVFEDNNPGTKSYITLE